MIISKCRNMGEIKLPSITADIPMMPFKLKDLSGLYGEFKYIAKEMLRGIEDKEGTGFLTIHGRYIDSGDTLRRGGAHIDGNYMNYNPSEPFSSFGRGGGNGWKLGQDGPYISTDEHNLSYNNKRGGIILASTVAACLGFIGKFEGKPKRGGDCTHISLNQPFLLKPNKVYYGNNHFIHESIPVNKDCHRTFYRITMPITHKFEAMRC